jgi:hypothetical protein
LLKSSFLSFWEVFGVESHEVEGLIDVQIVKNLIIFTINDITEFQTCNLFDFWWGYIWVIFVLQDILWHFQKFFDLV